MILANQPRKHQKLVESVRTTHPNPAADWITQRELAGILGVCARTASLWAKAGRLQPFEHGFIACGRRKYSRALVQHELRRRWDEATARQSSLAGAATDSVPGQ